MKKLVLLTCSVCLNCIAQLSPVSCTSQTIGNTTFINDSDGNSGTIQTIGNTTFYRDSNGNSATVQKIGDTKLYSDSYGRSATVGKIGDTTFYRDSEGNSATISRIGDTTYYNGSSAGKTTVYNSRNAPLDNEADGNNKTIGKVGIMTYYSEPERKGATIKKGGNGEDLPIDKEYAEFKKTIREMQNEPTTTKRTLGIKSAAGVDVQFEIPSSMTCSKGHRQHVVYNMKRTIGNYNVNYVMSVRVDQIGSAKEFNKQFGEDRDSRESELKIKEIAERVMDWSMLIDYGITSINNQSMIWITHGQDVDFQSIKCKIACKTYMFPVIGDKFLQIDFYVSRFDGTEIPHKELQLMEKLEMKVLSSIKYPNR